MEMSLSWDSFTKWLLKPKPVSEGKVVATFVYGISPEQPGTGALIDPRTEEQKLGDVHFAELVANASGVQWVLKSVIQWRKFQVLYQATTGACVAFTMAKLLGIMRFLNDKVFVIFSPGDIYRRRTNQDTQGMSGTDPFIIAAQGVTLDSVVPSQGITEQEINSLIIPNYANEIAQLFKLENPKPVVLPTKDIDAVASVIQETGKGVMVWFYFTADEWALGAPTQTGGAHDADTYNRPKVLHPIGLTDLITLRHSVTAVDSTLLPDGKKALVIEDSAWFGGLSRRVIDEDFYNARNWYAAYPMNFKHVQVVDVLPKYTFTKNLVFIPWDDGLNQPSMPSVNEAQKTDVVALQKALQILTDERGNTYFPVNVTASGYYGAATANAVYLWQSDHKVAPQPSLDKLAGKSFGPASVAEMNKELL